MTSEGDRSTDVPTHTANLPAQSPDGRRVLADAPGVAGFAPGTIVGERFRIIGLVGRGGMGEVYRADDLTLGQPVALKFLPSAVAADAVARERLFSEVRMARQVSHPNVCRVYDVGEVGGRHFLSMEYIDGEDLASLITRIGHLPSAKVLEIAKQLCAGLAAAHDKGVLHRDLKPRNVMIDGRGHARITDFGLAVAVQRPADAGPSPGTPIYMAPEQLSGHRATIRSDIYALGLVLYEVATGRQPFKSRTLEQLRAEKIEVVPSPPSELVGEIDPRVERAILRCLERDPASRPASVHQLAANLPGGDPLASALAAGETPSPQMVAAASGMERLSPTAAAALIVGLAAAVVASIWLGSRAIVNRLAPLERPPDALAERARRAIDLAGYPTAAADRAFGVEYSGDFLQYLEASSDSPRRWSALGPEAVRFWYRQSASPIRRLAFSIGVSPRVTMTDPPIAAPHDVLVVLNGAGALRRLVGIRPDSPATPNEPDWAGLFREAGLTSSDFDAVEPLGEPVFWAERRHAWRRVSPPTPADAVVVDAASVGEGVVSFEVHAPWDAGGSEAFGRLFYDRGFGGNPDSPGQRVANSIGIALTGIAMFGGLLFARRNLRLGRGDRRGATRLAVFVSTLLAVAWLLDEHHVAGAHEWYLIVSFAGRALVVAGIVWWTYIAFEPYVRRQWPTQLVSWSRLLAGSVRDPLVGRDVLVGVTAGAGLTVALLAGYLLASWLGWPAERLASPTWHAWLGPRQGLSLMLQLVCNALLDAFTALFIVVLARMAVRREIPAAILAAAFLATPDMLLSEHAALAGATFFAIYLAGVLILIRVGLLAVIALRFTVDLLQAYPIVFDASTWYAGLGVVALVVLAAIVAASAYIALARAGVRPATTVH